MNKDIIKNKIKQRLSEESAVGKKGRTGKSDAEMYVEENGELIESFKKIVKKMGGKSVAGQLLGKMKMGSLKIPPVEVEEARINDSDIHKFSKHLVMGEDDFDDFVDLGVIDAFPRIEGNQTRVDIYKKGRPILLGFYYPDVEVLHGEKDLTDMAFNSMRY